MRVLLILMAIAVSCAYAGVLDKLDRAIGQPGELGDGELSQAPVKRMEIFGKILRFTKRDAQNDQDNLSDIIPGKMLLD